MPEAILQASDDGINWVPCPLAGKYWHCGICEVGVLSADSHKCSNCLAAIRVLEHACV